MAVQTGTGKNPKPPGAPATLKQGTRPVARGETYKSDLTKGTLARGGLGPVRKDPITGADQSRTGYGQNNFSGASSAGVVESSKLSDLDITVQDEALDKLVRQGVGVKVEDAPVGDLTGQERPISADPFPPSYGAARQQDPDKVFGKATSLPAGATDNETQPVRKPS
jgi:hypothetical protein